MNSTEKDAAYYARFTRAKRGYAKRRTELLGELRMETVAMIHSAIMATPYKDGSHNQSAVVHLHEAEARILKIKTELDTICVEVQ